VLLKWLQDHHLVETERGKIAIGWLVVEDLAMVLALVLIPAAAGFAGGSEAMRDPVALQIVARLDISPGIGVVIAATLIKMAVFIGLMLIVGRRVVPALLHWVAHSGSRELFRLAVLATALGIAFGAATMFGVSLALGAFFAGMILSESKLSSRAAQESLPLRDAFAVLFFVSVGMLFDPASLLGDPLPVIATVAIIVLCRSVAVFAVVMAFRHSVATAVVIAASRAQIGEFSFILAQLGVGLGLLSQEGQALILSGAIISIVLNPVLVYGGELLRPALEAWLTPPRPPEPAVASSPDAAAAPVAAPAAPPEPPPAGEPFAQEPSELAGHTVLIGCGRVGSAIEAALDGAGSPYLVIETAEVPVAALRERGLEAFAGNAASPEVLALANLAAAHSIVIAIPDAFEAGQIAAQARHANPSIRIVARAHSDAEAGHLAGCGADIVVLAEREIARGMLERMELAAGPPPEDIAAQTGNAAPQRPS
jgi:CPA2 family monovalent cation:H+ antiporter-2